MREYIQDLVYAPQLAGREASWGDRCTIYFEKLTKTSIHDEADSERQAWKPRPRSKKQPCKGRVVDGRPGGGGRGGDSEHQGNNIYERNMEARST